MSEDEILEKLNSETSINRVPPELRREPLEIYDKLMLEFKKNNLFEHISAYIYTFYIIENVLETTLKQIKTKVQSQRRLEQNEKDKIKLLKNYFDYFGKQNLKYYDYNYVRIMAERNKTKFISAQKECEKLLNYNENKSISINFEQIEETKTTFIMFAEDLLYDIKEKQINTSIKDVKNNIIENNKCCTMINQFIKKYIES